MPTTTPLNILDELYLHLDRGRLEHRGGSRPQFRAGQETVELSPGARCVRERVLVPTACRFSVPSNRSEI